jgi:hypothetical protein
MTNQTKRDDFTPSVARKLAARAGFLCSMPECPQRTVGPGSDPEGTVSIGVAAHICGAASGPGSIRFDLRQSTKERSSIDNGIWLCQNHAKLIDSDPETYTVAILRNWKVLHEAKIRRELEQPAQTPITEVSGTHIALGKGNVTGLDIRGPAIIRPGTISRAEGEGTVTGTRIGG